VLARITKVVTILAAVTAVSGCGYLFGDQGLFPSKNDQYKKEREQPLLRLPEGVESNHVEEVYVIPAVSNEYVSPAKFEAPRPTPLLAAAAADAIRIQKLGDDTWALVNVAPGQLWPQVRSFLGSVNWPVSFVDPQAGVIDTQYLPLKDDDREARFRFRVERGVQRGTSELHILHMFRAIEDNWPEQSDDFAIESDVLQSVAQYIANSTEEASVSMIADRSISSEGKLRLIETSPNQAYLELDLPFDRAWASLQIGIENSGFKVDDLNRSEGVYYVTYLGEDAEEGSGWFGWLFSDEDNPLIGQGFEVKLISKSKETQQISLIANDPSAIPERGQPMLISLIKGNIN
jgi:outer membrane protein assembly factor BamC